MSVLTMLLPLAAVPVLLSDLGLWHASGLLRFSLASACLRFSLASALTRLRFSLASALTCLRFSLASAL